MIVINILIGVLGYNLWLYFVHTYNLHVLVQIIIFTIIMTPIIIILFLTDKIIANIKQYIEDDHLVNYGKDHKLK